MRKKESHQTKGTLKDEILKLLKINAFTSRKDILSQLNSDADSLDKALTELQADSKIEAQRGRKGGFRRIEQNNITENSCYLILKQSIAEWFEVKGGKAIVVQTSYAGRRKTGGKWTRPDFYIVHKIKYDFYHQVVVEYVAIEVKVWGSTSSVADVYEVLNHRTRATGAILLYVGSIQNANETETFAAIEYTCAQHGIGLVFVPLDSRSKKVGKIQTKNFNEQVEWAAVVALPENISEFIQTQFNNKDKEKYQQLAELDPK